MRDTNREDRKAEKQADHFTLTTDGHATEMSDNIKNTNETNWCYYKKCLWTNKMNRKKHSWRQACWAKPRDWQQSEQSNTRNGEAAREQDTRTLKTQRNSLTSRQEKKASWQHALNLNRHPLTTEGAAAEEEEPAVRRRDESHGAYMCVCIYTCVCVWESCAERGLHGWAIPVQLAACESVCGRGSRRELWSLQSVTEEFWQRGNPPQPGTSNITMTTNVTLCTARGRDEAQGQHKVTDGPHERDSIDTMSASSDTFHSN